MRCGYERGKRMTREELKVHCEKQIENCEMWAKHKGEEPHGKVYEEHKLILELLEQEPSYNSVNSLVESKLKNPKAKTFDILHFVADNAGLSTFEAIEKAYNMGVSEQESILDKIRAEIDRERSFQRAIDEYDIATGLRKALEIIDKYKAETGDKE